MAKNYKLVVFVPRSHLTKVREAICQAGAGRIGKNYDYCTFASKGTGTFRPLKGANPFIGKKGELTRVAEVRLETIVPAKAIKKVIAALLKTHPYEEPAYDLYPLANIV